jgi:hypothetical protein
MERLALWARILNFLISACAGRALFNLDFGQFGTGFFRTPFLKAFDPVIQQ